MSTKHDFQHIAQQILNADALLITAGAGMGVDSGLPDFRGPEGFWRAYPNLKKYQKSFMDMANGELFYENPRLAWWFYAHRFNLYAQTQPHAGYDILLNWVKEYSLPYFIFTSNVDGHFAKAGFAEDNIYECHGSINYLQCIKPCNPSLQKITELNVNVNSEQMQAIGQLPHCPKCNKLARPNILMFNDYHWLDNRANQQSQAFTHWLNKFSQKNIVIIELGAGIDVPTVRNLSERINGQLIRINPRDNQTPKDAISIDSSALSALTNIAKAMQTELSQSA